MRLLIVTQTVDTEDPVLGFFVRWIEEFAKHLERIEVICLKEGKHTLPTNVRVHSLGKERGAADRATYAWRFFKLAWELRRDYDAVFVHMNQEYILIAGWLWKLFGKRIYLWRNHYAGSWLTDFVATFCTNVFCTSAYSYTAKYHKAIIMPVGVDSALFTPKGTAVPRSVLFLARMSPSKRPDLLVDALGILARDGVQFSATFVGSPLPKDEGHYHSVREKVRALGLESRVTFRSAVAHSETPALYRSHEVFVNTSRSGMFDKTIFEATASGSTVLASSKDIERALGAELYFTTAQELATKLRAILVGEMNKQTLQKRARDYANKHSLTRLGIALAEAIRV